MAAPFESFSDKEHSSIEIGIRCVAKGYQECQFQVKTGETFNVVKKVGDKGRAFKIIDTKRGQLGLLQRELVPVLWPVTSNISWYVSIIIALLLYFKLMIMIDCRLSGQLQFHLP